MARIDVPGGWIELRDPKTVKEKARRPIMAKASQLSTSAKDVAVDASSINESSVMGFYEFNDLVAIALIESWSFPYEISVDSLGEMEWPTHDAIQRATAPLLSQLMPSFEVSPDSESPTVPSGA